MNINNIIKVLCADFNTTRKKWYRSAYTPTRMLLFVTNGHIRYTTYDNYYHYKDGTVHADFLSISDMNKRNLKISGVNSNGASIRYQKSNIMLYAYIDDEFIKDCLE